MIAKTRSLITVCSLLFAYAGWACEPPRDVAIPDGKSATEEQMVEANSALRSYVAAMQRYQSCLESDAQAVRTTYRASDVTSTLLQEDEFARRYNEASEALKETAEKFQKAVDDYKSRK